MPRPTAPGDVKCLLPSVVCGFPPCESTCASPVKATGGRLTRTPFEISFTEQRFSELSSPHPDDAAELAKLLHRPSRGSTGRRAWASRCPAAARNMCEPATRREHESA